MPITLPSVVMQYKSLPIQLFEDGSCTITLRKGYYDENGNFMIVALDNFHANPAETSAILDVEGTAGVTRRADLSAAVYQFCIDKGAQAGVIS